MEKKGKNVVRTKTIYRGASTSDVARLLDDRRILAVGLGRRESRYKETPNSDD